MRNYFRNGNRMHRLTLCQNCNPPPSFEAVYCFICGRRRVVVARYRMICLVPTQRKEEFLLSPMIKAPMHTDLKQVWYGICIGILTEQRNWEIL